MGKAKERGDFRLYCNVIKRLCDLITSLLFLVILFIPGTVIALIIKLTSNGPVFFRQNRVGKNGRLFKIYKFRSMVANAPHEMSTAEFNDASRYITKFGNLLRKTSLDELPQLINVLKGDMSIVGPRPLIPAEKEINCKRHELKIDQILPGITGLAQINGRDRITDHTKLLYDLKYYQNVSIKLDTQIIFRTVTSVVTGKDIQV